MGEEIYKKKVLCIHGMYKRERETERMQASMVLYMKCVKYKINCGFKVDTVYNRENKKKNDFVAAHFCIMIEW